MCGICIECVEPGDGRQTPVNYANTSPTEIRLATSAVTRFTKGSKFPQTDICMNKKSVDGIKTDSVEGNWECIQRKSRSAKADPSASLGTKKARQESIMMHGNVDGSDLCHSFARNAKKQVLRLAVPRWQLLISMDF